MDNIIPQNKLNQQTKYIVPRGRPAKRTNNQFNQAQLWTQHIRVHLGAEMRYVQENSGLKYAFLFKLNQKDKENKFYTIEEVKKKVSQTKLNIFEKRYYEFLQIMSQTKIKSASEQFNRIYQIILNQIKKKDYKISSQRHAFQKESDEIQFIIINELNTNANNYSLINLKGQFIENQLKIEGQEKQDKQVIQTIYYDLNRFIKIIVHCVIGQIFNFENNAYYMEIFNLSQITKKKPQKKLKMNPLDVGPSKKIKYQNNQN